MKGGEKASTTLTCPQRLYHFRAAVVGCSTDELNHGIDIAVRDIDTAVKKLSDMLQLKPIFVKEERMAIKGENCTTFNAILASEPTWYLPNVLTRRSPSSWNKGRRDLRGGS